MSSDKQIIELIEKYEKKIFDLEQLIEISKGLNSTLGYNTLIDSILFTCMGQMQVIEVGIFLKKNITQDNFYLSRNYKGFELEHDEEYSIPHNSKLIEFFETKKLCFTPQEIEAEIPSEPALKTIKRIDPWLVVPLLGKMKINGLILVGKRINTDYFTESEKKYLLNIASLAGIAIHNAELYEMATTDMMTGLKIHQFFQLVLQEEREIAKKTQAPLTLAMLDIDHFKQFNDSYGHTFGDTVLKRVAELLMENTRYNDTAARYGGEEFVIILPSTELKESTAIMERVRRIIQNEKLDYSGQEVGVTISIGLAEYNPDTDKNNEDFINRADKALYISKMNGRNRVSSL